MYILIGVNFYLGWMSGTRMHDISLPTTYACQPNLAWFLIGLILICFAFLLSFYNILLS